MAHLLFALAFPFKARIFMSEYSKIAHITVVIVVIVLGIFPGVIVLSTSNYQIYRFPPDACYPSVELIFHTFGLPVAIYSTIALAMLFTVFTILRRVSATSSGNYTSIYICTCMHIHTYICTYICTYKLLAGCQYFKSLQFIRLQFT